MGMSDVITVAGAGDKIVVSGGLVDVPAPGSISGTYFIDADRDDLDNDGQAVAGVTVQILAPENDRAAGTPDGPACRPESSTRHEFSTV